MNPKYLIGSDVFHPNGDEGEITTYDEEEGLYEIEWEGGFSTWETEEALDRWREDEEGDDYDYEPDVDEAQEWADFDPDC